MPMVQEEHAVRNEAGEDVIGQYTMILTGLIQKARQQNDRLALAQIREAFGDLSPSADDIRQIRFIFDANGIHVADDTGEAGSAAPAADRAGQEEDTAAAPEDSDENLSAEELLDRLDRFIGLDAVKKEIHTNVNMLLIEKQRREHGLVASPVSLHMVFSGNPGTGKTTVARLVGKIYKKLGVLSGGQFIEADRSLLVGRYVGETEAKTKAVITQSLGGMLFIDEAYSLARDTSGRDFGIAAIDLLIKAMEDHRDDFAVIAAGYPDLMEQFLSANPGLRSRFGTIIHFPDYSPKELSAIFRQMCRQEQYEIDTPAMIYVDAFFRSRYVNRTKDFANARDVRNFFEKAKKNQANRLIREGTFTRKSLEGLMLDDVRNISLD